MVKASIQFVCSECGWDGNKWYGKCPQCGQWGSVDEFRESARSSRLARTRRNAAGRSVTHHIITDNASQTHASTTHSNVKANTSNISHPLPLASAVTSIPTDHQQRLSTHIGEFDRVLGGGMVLGSVMLVAGEPGVGKSTLLLETAGAVADHHPNRPVLYISGEESLAQVTMRAQRIGVLHDNLLVASTTDLANVLDLIEQQQPQLAIVDSAQTIVSQDIDGMSGGNAQVREVASGLIDVAKTYNIPIVLVGHVTKDGVIAGPRTLEHLVDVVCQFDGDKQTALRFLRSSKNRFGPTNEVGCFDMSGTGMVEVSDPSGLFITHDRKPVEGTCITFTLDGVRSLPIEIQSLVTSSALPTPRRATSGIDSNRLAMLVAVLYRHGGLNLLGQDIYVSTIAGGLAKEPSCDLSIVIALASAKLARPVAHTTCAIGEISLTGQVRPVPQLTHRIQEAARLGFTTILCPPIAKLQRDATLSTLGIDLIEVSTLRHALQYVELTRH